MVFVALLIVSLLGWTGSRLVQLARPPDAPVVMTSASTDGLVAESSSTDGLVAENAITDQRPEDIVETIKLPSPVGSDAPVARPARPTGWYQRAALDYGLSPQLLEALHEVESNASGDSCIANLEGSHATGPFQFKPATFRQFGVDGNHDGVVDICGFADSLFSAAHYLQRIGADADPASGPSRRALTRYGTDVERVVSLALAYQDRDRR